MEYSIQKKPNKIIMPILDPSLQFCLFKYFLPESNENNINDFFLRYLQRASINLFRNFETIKIHRQFKLDLNSNCNILNEQFGNLYEFDKDLNDISIKNFYSHIYQKISTKYSLNLLPVQDGNYYEYVSNNKIQLFQPFVKYSQERSWFLTDSPIAILCVNLLKLRNEYKDIISLINLEVDIIAASGFSIVLCVLAELESDSTNYFLTQTVKSHNFSEIHFNLRHNNNYEKNDSKIFIFFEIINKYVNNNGYFYLYTTFFKKKIFSFRKYKESELLKIFFFSDDMSYVFKNTTLTQLKQPFLYCKTGFNQNLIRILLCNIPLYNTHDSNDLIPSFLSGLSFAYVSKEDFYSSENFRIPILYADKSNFNKLIEKYVDFEDIHLIRPDFYVKDTLYLTRTEKSEMEIVNTIRKNEKSFIHKDNIVRYFKKSCNKFIESRSTEFVFHTNQLFTAYEACQNLIGYGNKKRIVYQVETGEGKSIIIQLIASTLAKLGKIVHIVSSNINLATRDYYYSFDFFKIMKLKSAVLFHYNELPFINVTDEKKGYKKEYFPDEFFNRSLFENSLSMNFDVCQKAQIIFSTFSNFESYYLSQIGELKTASAKEYFSKSSLVIDEADSILIDEIADGTIISRPMISNASDILTYIYSCIKLHNTPKNQILDVVKDRWKDCVDISIEDIDEMEREINIVNHPDFSNGKKYSIEQRIVNDDKKNIFKKIGDKIKKKDKENEIKTESVVIPFDSDHKGILEPNKEFNGFIQQFIAIKEMFNQKGNIDMTINDVSMDYLYVSHPIFVKLYSGVCGLTGTIGSRSDKEMLSTIYGISTKKIPRNQPNHLIKLPIILCSNIKERNLKVVNEIIKLHIIDIPVLVILKDLNEISDIFTILTQKGIKNINIFDGKDEKVKPDIIAGLKGAVSLGTNFCGRGADIKEQSKPLHVIVSYFTSNTRIMNQAFGRTARQGNNGTVRVICLLDEFKAPNQILNDETVKSILDDFEIKSKKQEEFINFFKDKNWIFNSDCIQKIEIKSDQIKKMRKTRINVNRLNAFKYKYPICMSIPTFIKIQAQRIFSLINCPNCKYTWLLFQKYIQETILETWSLIVNQADKEFKKITYQSQRERNFYEIILDEKISDAKKSLLNIIPNDTNDIVSTFMHIYKFVVDKYEDKILLSLSQQNSEDNISNFIFSQFANLSNKRESKTDSFLKFNFGFIPFTLIPNSSCRIDNLNDENENERRNFISDPELKYKRKNGLVSITEAIDVIFEKICNKINEIIGHYIGFKFFMRRTLAGCEFGVCFDFNIEVVHDNYELRQNCIIDKDPLFVFTIFVKRMNQKHFLAAILIIGLVYIAIIVKNILEIIAGFSVKTTKFVVKKLSILAFEFFAEKGINTGFRALFDLIFNKLISIIHKQLDILKGKNDKFVGICQILLNIFTCKEFPTSDDYLKNLIKNTNKRFKFKSIHKNIIGNLPLKFLIKTGVLLMICFVTFMMNFHYQDNQKQKLKFEETVTKEYEKTSNIKETAIAFKIEKKAKDACQYDISQADNK